ncbi:MAG TPA: hypothetical protein VF711_00240 [Acidimicrobiales bacterium]|jgi:hypothetical protein
MFTKSRAGIWASALAIGVFQVMGSFGAADNQPERKAIDALALALVLAGPVALAWRDRWPLAAVAVSAAAADVYIGLGHPYGPIFVSVVVALFWSVQTGHRRPTWVPRTEAPMAQRPERTCGVKRPSKLRTHWMALL